jgi:hypothetical protein
MLWLQIFVFEVTVLFITVIAIRNLHIVLPFLQKCIDIYFLACYNQGVGFLILQKEKNYG